MQSFSDNAAAFERMRQERDLRATVVTGLAAFSLALATALMLTAAVVAPPAGADAAPSAGALEFAP